MSAARQKATLSLFQKGMILVVVTLTFELAFLATLSGLLVRSHSIAIRQAEAKESIAQANEIYKLSYDSWMTLFAYGLTKNKQYGQKYQEQMREMSKIIHLLKVKTMDNPVLAAQIIKIELLKEDMDALLRPLKEELDQGSLSLLRLNQSDFKRKLEKITTSLVAEVNQFTEQQEKSELADPRLESRSNELLYQCIAVGVILNVMLAIFLAISFHRGTVKRLQAVVENTALLSKRKPLNPQLTGSDEIAQLDKVFHSMANELREVDRLKQEFFAMVSHDLRSPLTSIQFFLTMLSEGKYGELTQKGAEKSQSANRGASRLLALVNDLLDLDKLESGRFDMELKNIPVLTVINRSLDAVRPIAEKQNISFEVPDTQEYVHADEDRLIQVMVNLLGNAVKYSPEGQPVVISVNRLAEMVEVRVTDRGRGVPEELKDAIFERFKQVDADDHKIRGGSGLGLAISKALIEQQGGLIGVDSDEGKGSSFWFRIPAAMALTGS